MHVSFSPFSSYTTTLLILASPTSSYFFFSYFSTEIRSAVICQTSTINKSGKRTWHMFLPPSVFLFVPFQTLRRWVADVTNYSIHLYNHPLGTATSGLPQRPSSVSSERFEETFQFDGSFSIRAYSRLTEFHMIFVYYRGNRRLCIWYTSE